MFRLSSKLHKFPIHFCRFGRRLSASLAPLGACRFEPRPFAASQPAYITFYPASQLTASQLRLSFVKLSRLCAGKCYALPAKEGFPVLFRKASRFNTNSSSLPLAGYAFSRLTPLRGYSFTRRLRPPATGSLFIFLGAIPCGHIPHPYNPICTAQAGASSFRRWQVGPRGRTRLGTTRSNILNPFDRPQSATKARHFS